MKKRIAGFILIVTLLCLLSIDAAAQIELPEEYIEEGITLDGDVLVIPEGVEWIGDRYDWREIDEAVDEQDEGAYEPSLYLDGTGLWEVKSIRLPSTLRGIGGDGFDCWSLDELVIPEGVEKVDNPFYITQIGRLVLPSTAALVRIYSSWESTIGALEVSPENPYYKSEDGVLFTKDGKTLLCYPGGRGGTHYDVPKGVEEIGEWAFRNNEDLQSVSLPIGLKKIGAGAFCSCGRLESIGIPLTVREIEWAAFADCVSLQRVTMSDALRVQIDAMPLEYDSEAVFYNCPSLGGAFVGDNAATSGEDYDPKTYIAVETQSTQAIASPGNAQNGIPVYEKNDRKSKVVYRAPSGTTLSVEWAGKTWSEVISGKRADMLKVWGYDGIHYEAGYVDRNDLVIEAEMEELFDYASMYAKREKTVLYNRMNTDSERTIVSADKAAAMTIGNCGLNIPWAYAYLESSGEWISGFVPLQHVEMKRENTGDARTLGVVISEKTGDRVNLRQKADKSSNSLGKYYTGIQLEILGSRGDFYHVNIQGMTGYMMKKYVRIIPQIN